MGIGRSFPCYTLARLETISHCLSRLLSYLVVFLLLFQEQNGRVASIPSKGEVYRILPEAPDRIYTYIPR